MHSANIQRSPSKQPCQMATETLTHGEIAPVCHVAGTHVTSIPQQLGSIHCQHQNKWEHEDGMGWARPAALWCGQLGAEQRHPRQACRHQSPAARRSFATPPSRHLSAKSSSLDAPSTIAAAAAPCSQQDPRHTCTITESVPVTCLF